MSVRKRELVNSLVGQVAEREEREAERGDEKYAGEQEVALVHGVVRSFHCRIIVCFIWDNFPYIDRFVSQQCLDTGRSLGAPITYNQDGCVEGGHGIFG